MLAAFSCWYSWFA